MMNFKGRLSRRQVITSLAASTATALIGLPATSEEAAHKTLILLFLRGGMDGLSAVVPFTDPAYYRHRGPIAISPPDRTAKGVPPAIDLKNGYALHPSLGPLHAAYRARELAFIHAVGNPKGSRSHGFEQDVMETGTEDGRRYEGWLGELSQLLPRSDADFQYVSTESYIDRSLWGAPNPISLKALNAFDLPNVGNDEKSLRAMLEASYGASRTVAGKAGMTALRATSTSRSVRRQLPSDPKSYAVTVRGLDDISRLLRAGVPVRVATVNSTAWDTHRAQGAEQGLLAGKFSDLANGLASFRASIGELSAKVVVIVATEFGRTVRRNGAGGTDHGAAGVMMVMGSEVRGGKVYGDFRGLAEENLKEERDLLVTTDYRQVFSEVAQSVLGRTLTAAEGERLFPGFASKAPLGLFERVATSQVQP